MPDHPIIELLTALERELERVPGVEVTLWRGAPAAAALLAKAREAAYMPDELLALYAVADGISLDWRTTDGELGGSMELPTLARNLESWDSIAFNDSDFDIGVRVIDVTGDEVGSMFAVYAGGDSGFWNGHDDTFQCEGYRLESYFEAGVENLFLPGWVEHVAVKGLGAVMDEVAEVRERLGMGEGAAAREPTPVAAAAAPVASAPARRRQPRRLVLDDDPERLAHFRDLLPGCVTVSTYDEAIAALSGRRFSEVYLDHDIIGERTGADVAAWMASELPARKRPSIVVVHSHNARGALDMRTTLVCKGFVVEARPFEGPDGAGGGGRGARGFLTGLRVPQRKTEARKRRRGKGR